MVKSLIIIHYFLWNILKIWWHYLVKSICFTWDFMVKTTKRDSLASTRLQASQTSPTDVVIEEHHSGFQLRPCTIKEKATSRTEDQLQISILMWSEQLWLIQPVSQRLLPSQWLDSTTNGQLKFQASTFKKFEET